MRRTLQDSTIVLALALSGCATQGGESATGPSSESSTDPQTAADVVSTFEATNAPQVELRAAPPSLTMHEVFLDPTGTSALTVDLGGHTQLWPRLLTADTVEPFELPLFEPQFLSVARDNAQDARKNGVFRVACIDAAGATIMGQVEVNGDSATYTELIRLPPSDPALEVHVLSDGRRALWLGLDHTIRLYDLGAPAAAPESAELARLQRTAFVPWQLRLTHGADGTRDHAVAILAGPTRAVPLAIGERSLDTGAESPELPLDRGPNRNDLALTPDGARLVMLRRPTAKTKEVHLYVHELGTDAIDLLGGEVDVNWRGRMLLTGPTTALLETGMGKGFSFDLSKAVPLESVKVVTRRRKPRPEPVLEPAVELPLPRLVPPPDRDFELDFERYAGKRVHVDFRAGVRALPDGDALIVDPLESDTHFVHGTTPFDGISVAFSPDGETLAVGANTELVVLKRDSMTELGRRPLRAARALAFVDEAHLASYRQDETLEVLSLGALEASPAHTLAVPVEWVVERSVFARSGQGLTLYVRGDRPADPAYAVRFDGPKPAEIEKLKGDALTRARPVFSENQAVDASGKTYRVERREQTYPRWSGDHDDHRVLIQTAPDGASVETPIRRGMDAEILPDPTGTRVVVRQGSTLSVYRSDDLSRAWTRSVEAREMSWSADGSELAVIGSRGLRVYAGEDGRELASKTDGAPRHEERRDEREH